MNQKHDHANTRNICQTIAGKIKFSAKRTNIENTNPRQRAGRWEREQCTRDSKEKQETQVENKRAEETTGVRGATQGGRTKAKGGGEDPHR